MKIHQMLFVIFAGLPVIVSAQKTKEVKKTVEVEVIKENNDTKTVIRTTENGKVKEELFIGNEEDCGDDKTSKVIDLKTELDELGLDLSRFEGGGRMENRINKLTNLLTEINNYRLSLISDIEENDNRTTLINDIYLYLYSDVNNQSGISDEVLDTNKKVLDFFKTLKTPVNEKDLTDFYNDLKKEKIPNKTKNQLQIKIIDPNIDFSKGEADDMVISMMDLIEDVEEELYADTIKEEIFKGKEADARLKEIQKTYKTNENKDYTLDVEVKEIKGKKTVKVTETINGQTTVTEYEGKAADKKLKELQVPVPEKPNKKSKGLKKL